METKHHKNLAADSSRIVGERIFLEELNDEYLSQDYIDWMQDENVLQYLTGRNGGYNAQELKEYVAQMNGSSSHYLFGIFLKEGNIHIGNIKIGNINSLHKFGDLGLVVGNKNMWGKGYATEAIALATRYAFDELNLNKLTAGMVAENVGSYKAFMKAGYNEVGRLRKQILLKGRYVDTVLVEKCKDQLIMTKRQQSMLLSDEKGLIGKSQELYNQAKKIIPGGTQLLSKRPEMYLPDFWPAYYKEAKGCELWDLDDNHYYDLSIMGIGTCVLGYANDEINRAVKAAIDKGNMTTLNCYEEVELTQKLIELHSWAQMVRYSKTGGEACAIAVRIARAHSKKEKIAFCGYHGWSDWYLAANLAGNENLDGQLLPGLEPNGIPRGLTGSSMPFKYGDIEGFKKLIKANEGEIGVVIMEVCRHQKANLEFLKEVRGLSRRIGAVFIFDEISSGFRVTAGGMHMLYGIEPDMMILGKALGNGYPISCVIGTRDVMQAAQTTFISSTYWTERIGFVAALETIKIFKRDHVAKKLVETGGYLANGLRDIFTKHALKIDIAGIPSVLIMTTDEEEKLVIKTIFTQEMLKRGYLASSTIYVSIAHTRKIVDQYLSAASEVFGDIAEALRMNALKEMLDGPVCHSGFKRLA